MITRLFPVLRRVLGLLVLCCAAVPFPAGAQDANGPLVKTGLLTAIRTNGLQPNELVEIINRRGLAFPMSEADEAEMRAAGAPDLVIDVMWAKENFEIKPGPPLTEEAIIASLQAGVPPKRLERMVRIRSAKLVVNRELADKIKSAGGTDALLGTILTNIYEAPIPDPIPPTPLPDQKIVKPVDQPTTEASKKQYDDLIAQANDMRKKGNHGRAAEILAEAKKVDPKRPEAYAISGLIWITSAGGVVRAGAEYASAIERDGEITIPMVHVHGHTMTGKQKFCSGPMTISRKAVIYAGVGGDNYTIETGRINTVAINTSKVTLGALGGTFKIGWTDAPIRQQEENFRVDIGKDDREADRIVVDLIRKCMVH